LFTRWFDMHLSSSSAAGVRFLTSVREGRGLNRSAREAGIGKETGYRWLCEAYIAHRRGGKSIAEREAVMRLASARSIAWKPRRGPPVGITLA
jgi:transposase, IS30 family